MMTLQNIYDQKLASGELKPDDDHARAIGALDRLSTALASYHPRKKRFFRRKKEAPKGFYLYGGVGRGKTMVMDLFYQSAPAQKKRRVHFHAFMLEVHDFMHQRRVTRKDAAKIDDDLMACARMVADQATLLCFDEFQVKDVAHAMILGRLFTALFDLGVVIVMTSNIAPDDLYKDGLQRDRFLPFIALLKERLNVVHFTGGRDYRLHRIMGKKLYFWPSDTDALTSLQHIFDQVADGAAGVARDITIKGRVIHVPRAAHEVAWFSFEDICGIAASAVDYLELARRFHLFVITDVPRMDDSRRDAALRFVTLIDTLYDNRRMVAISAAAPVDQLYKGDFHAGVFDRTASRLMEMQSDSYRRLSHEVL